MSIRWIKVLLGLSPIQPKENNSQIAYEYKIQDQVSLQIPGIFEKLSTAFLAWYNQNRKEIVSE
jgi:hypothetical protein